VPLRGPCTWLGNCFTFTLYCLQIGAPGSRDGGGGFAEIYIETHSCRGPSCSLHVLHNWCDVVHIEMSLFVCVSVSEDITVPGSGTWYG